MSDNSTIQNLSLLREKFTIRGTGSTSSPVIALGNRLKIDLPHAEHSIIVRCHSMHMTLRFGAEIIRQSSYTEKITNVPVAFRWDVIWKKLITAFEEENTPETWVAIYCEGKSIYSYGDHHTFFDIIEQCEYKNRHNTNEKYENSIIMAQKAFQQMGKTVLIEQESHVGFILDNATEIEIRFAIIMRIPGQKANFVIRMSKNNDSDKKPQPYICLSFSADYIEAINMAVRSGFLEDKQDTQKPDPQYLLLQKRLAQLDLSIQQIERQFTVNYRPERPDFEFIQERCKSLN